VDVEQARELGVKRKADISSRFPSLSKLTSRIADVPSRLHTNLKTLRERPGCVLAATTAKMISSFGIANTKTHW
jgi:hypothetical protein